MSEQSLTNSKRLKFGLLSNGLQLEQWQVNAVDHLLQNGMQLVLVVLNDSPPTNTGLFQRLPNYPFSRLLYRLWDRFIFKPDSKNTQPIDHLLEHAHLLKVKPIVIKGSNHFSDTDIEVIGSYKLDFMLRFGFNIMRGNILKAAKYGIWSFHHDDEEVIRGGPPGFWEVYEGHDANGVILQQLTDSLDKGLILKKNYFRTIKHSYKANLDQVYFESSIMPLQVCRSILAGQYQPLPSVSTATIYKPPGNVTMLLFGIKMPYRRIAFHFRHFFKHEDWNVGIVDMPLHKLLESTPNVNWLSKKQASAYIADPFVIRHNNEVCIFAEHFSYKTGKGTIVMAKETEAYKAMHIVLSDSRHYSFPYVFHIDNKLYCIPECYESGGVQLFRWHSNSSSFRFERELLAGVAAVDPVLFQHENKWWLLFTKKDLPSVHLYAYYADEAFGPFKPHANNPVKSDIRSSRNAGKLFMYDGKLIRPAQDCAEDYGVAVVLNEIVQLGPDRFEEIVYQQLKPFDRSGYHKGLHTVNGIDTLTVIDGKRFGFSLAGFRHQFKNKFSKTKL